MSTQTFTQQIRACKERADMTVSDLALWFERPKPTVRTWVIEGRTPTGAAGRLAWERLELLKTALRNRTTLPVPAHLSGRKRPDYIRELRDAARRNNRLSPLHPTV